MASRHERNESQIKEKVRKQTSTAITLCAILGLVACALINAIFERGVPDLVFWIFGAAIVPDAVKFFWERRP